MNAWTFCSSISIYFIHCKWNSLINISSFHGRNLFISTFSFKMYEFHPSFIFLPEAWIAPLSFTHNEYLKSCATTYKVPCAIVSLMEACMITMYKNTGIFFWHFLQEKFVILSWRKQLYLHKKMKKSQSWRNGCIVPLSNKWIHVCTWQKFKILWVIQQGSKKRFQWNNWKCNLLGSM